jgi:predicted nucleic acid-binding protein
MGRRVDIVFLDANVLFSAAYRADAGLRRLWDLKGVPLLTSAYAAEEARRNLPTDEQRAWLEKLLRSARVVETGVVQDHPAMVGVELAEKDMHILTAAIEAGATHLLTGDVRHFGHLLGRRVGGVLVLRPAEYLRLTP